MPSWLYVQESLISYCLLYITHLLNVLIINCMTGSFLLLLVFMVVLQFLPVPRSIIFCYCEPVSLCGYHKALRAISNEVLYKWWSLCDLIIYISFIYCWSCYMTLQDKLYCPLPSWLVFSQSGTRILLHSVSYQPMGKQLHIDWQCQKNLSSSLFWLQYFASVAMWSHLVFHTWASLGLDNYMVHSTILLL